MPYNPGISFDASPIANGLASAGQNIAQGLIERARKREEKEKWASALDALQPIVSEMSGGKIDLAKDTPKEAIPSLINLAENYQREQREAPLRALQIENEKLRQRLSQRELDQAATDADALKASARYLAADPTRYQPTGIMKPGRDNTLNSAADAALALQTYVNQGGSDPRVLAQLGDLAAAQMRGASKAGMMFPSLDALEKQFPRSQYDYNMTVDPASGAVSVPNVSPRAPDSNLPEGYEYDPAKPGAIRPIQGSEGDMKQQEVATAKQNRIRGEITRADTVLTEIDNVMPRITNLTSSFAGTVLNKIPGTDAANVQASIDTIKANIGFEQLQKMREASPTGGALGQITERELGFLQAALGNLSTKQSPEQLSQTLGRIRTHFSNWKAAMEGRNPDEDTAAPATADSILSKYGIK